MPTLYVENVPVKLYDALREQARRRKKSIAAEVLDLLEENVVTPEELKTRREVYELAQKIRSYKPRAAAKGADAVTLIREGRNR